MATYFRVKAGDWELAESWADETGGTTYYPSAPSSSDDVIFDANTPDTAAHTLSANAFCNDLTITGDFDINTATHTLNIYGNITSSAGTNFTGTTGVIRIYGETGTLTPQEVSILGEVRVQFAIDSGGAGTTCAELHADLKAYRNSAGSSQQAIWNNNQQFRANECTVILGERNSCIRGTFTGDNKFYALNKSSDGTQTYDTVWLRSNIEIEAASSWSGGGQGKPLYVMSDSDTHTPHTRRTITAGGTITCTDVTFAGITGAGTFDWDYSANTTVGNGFNNSGITFITGTNCYWVSGTGSLNDATKWMTASGGATPSRFPLPQDTMIFDDNSITAENQTITNNLYYFGSLDFDAVTAANTTVASTGTAVGCGSLIMPPKTSGSHGNNHTWYLAGSGSHGIKCRGANISLDINIQGGTYSLQDKLLAYRLLVSAGTFDANNQDALVQMLYSSGTRTRTISMGSGTWEFNIPGVAALVYPVAFDATGLTFNANTSLIKIISNAVTNDLRFRGAGQTFYNFENAMQLTSTASFRIDQDVTFNNFKVVTGRTQLFTAGVTVTAASYELEAGITLGSYTAAAHNLVKTGGGTVDVNDATISYSNADDTGVVWTATNSIDGGNNTGWIFAKSSNANFLLGFNH